MTVAVTPAVQLNELSKRFGTHVAVDAIDLIVPPGRSSASSVPTGPENPRRSR